MIHKILFFLYLHHFYAIYSHFSSSLHNANSDRTFFAAGSNCTGPPGVEVLYDESLDFNSSLLNTTINPDLLPERLDGKDCVKVAAHQYLRVNTIFEVARKHKLITAWTDKLPAYDIVRGPSGDSVDDLFVPEIASVNKTNFKEVEGYDQHHIQAILNWINGKDHDGNAFEVPSIFGGNFQSVSVAQKGVGEGYKDANATPSDDLLSALFFVDDALGQFLDALDQQHLTDKTVIIITAKHGQSPIDPSKTKLISSDLLAGSISVPVAQVRKFIFF